MSKREVESTLSALLAHDLAGARAALRRFRQLGGTVEEAYTELLAPALHEVGRLWASGVIAVSEEHVATALVEQLMAWLHQERSPQPSGSRARILVAAPAGERHVVGLRMTADILERHGFDVVFLGADTPDAELVAASERHRPGVLILAAYTTPTAQALAAATRALQAVQQPPHIVVGGASEAIRSALGDHDHALIVERLSDVLATVEAATGATGS